jgi:hypothetical protein
VNRPRPKRELEVRVMFEPNRYTERYLTVAYEQVVPIRRRSISITKGKDESNNRKVASRAGGAL